MAPQTPAKDAAAKAAAAKDAAPVEPTAEETAALRADLLHRSIKAALPMYIGHTDNNGVKLATKDRREWAPTTAELIGAFLEGVVFFSGPDRPRTLTKADHWNKINTTDGLENPQDTARSWYGSLHRLDAADRHAAGCKAMGWKTTDASARHQPTRDDLAAMDKAADPVAELETLATTVKVSTPGAGSADGMTPKERTALDGILRPVIKGALKGGKWGGTLSGLTVDYTTVQLTASIIRLTKDNPDAAPFAATMRGVLRDIESAKAEKAAAEKAAAEAAEAEAEAAADKK